MYNEYYLIKKIEDEVTEGASYATVGDSFAYKGEVVETPTIYLTGEFKDKARDINSFYPSIGDHILFMKDTGEDVVIDDKKFKVVALEDIIMKL